MRPKPLDHDARNPTPILNPLPLPIVPELLGPHLPESYRAPSATAETRSDNRSTHGDVLRDDCRLRFLIPIGLFGLYEVEIGRGPVGAAVARKRRVTAMLVDGAWVMVHRT
jgi:hypothetical protein